MKVLMRIARALACAPLLCVFFASAHAQPWPSKPIRIIVPFSAGSGTDIVARTVADQLSTQIGQPIVVENRVGAGGTIGVGAVAKSEPDGYTLLVHSTTHVVAASTYSNPGYDTARDFAGITTLASLPNVLVVAPNKYKTLKDMIDYAKANPGQIKFGTTGIATSTHLSSETFNKAAGIKGIHVPYRGVAPAMNDLAAGNVDYVIGGSTAGGAGLGGIMGGKKGALIGAAIGGGAASIYEASKR